MKYIVKILNRIKDLILKLLSLTFITWVLIYFKIDWTNISDSAVIGFYIFTFFLVSAKLFKSYIEIIKNNHRG